MYTNVTMQIISSQNYESTNQLFDLYEGSLITKQQEYNAYETNTLHY